MKHTPGPWKFKRTHVASENCWYVITDAKGYGPVVEVGGKDKNGQIAEAKYLITDPEIIEANARLIAAAPELLEALKNSLHFFNHRAEHPILFADDVFKQTQQAIAKAEGKQ